MGEEEYKKGSEMTMIPLRMINPSLQLNRPLSVLTTGNTRFQLPQGWTVKLVIRADRSRVDKYYYEPDTNKVFRSIREIERYINGQKHTPQCKSPLLDYHPRLTTGNFGSEKMVMSEGRLLRIDENKLDHTQLPILTPKTTAATSPFTLPEGWLVEKVPRKEQGFDKYYYEPGTRRKFRSLVAVEKHLQEEKRGNAPLSHKFEMGNWGQKRKRIGASASDLIEPPDKIKWVLKDSGGQAWDPFIGKTFVPHLVKNQWGFRFMELMRDKNGFAPELKRWKS